jgi:hypothetical protein
MFSASKPYVKRNMAWIRAAIAAGPSRFRLKLSPTDLASPFRPALSEEYLLSHGRSVLRPGFRKRGRYVSAQFTRMEERESSCAVQAWAGTVKDRHY